MFTRYRRILSVPGTLRFSGSALVARLPIAMVTIGIVLLVTAVTHSYGLGGSLSAAYLIAAAAFAVPQARLVDRIGQGPVLLTAAAVFALSLSAFVWAVQTEQPTWTAYLTAAVAGAGFPQIGSCVRARWRYVLDDRADVDTAFALESAVDEAVFMAGPILVTVLSTTWRPMAGLVCAIVAGTTGTLLFASQRRTEPVPHRHAHDTDSNDGSDGDSHDGPVSHARARLPWRVMAPVCLVGAALGALFGAAEVTTVAFSGEHHAKSYAGVLLALWALGSLIAGLGTGMVAWRVGPATRLRRGSVAMLLAMVPLTFIANMWVMGAWLFAAGFAIAPTLIASLSLVEQAVPHSRLTEGMAIVNTSLVAGVAPGAAVAGRVIDAHGASTAYLVAVASGLLAALAAQALRRPAGLRRTVPSEFV